MARATNSVKSAPGKALRSLCGPAKANQSSGRQDRRVFLSLGQGNGLGAGRVHRIKPAQLPAVALDARNAPFGSAASLPPFVRPTLPIMSLIGDLSAGGCSDT